MRDRLIGKGCGVAKSTPALAEPSALRWARESIAYIPVTASRKIGGPDDRVEQLRREAREAARRRSADMPSVAAQAVASLDAESSCRDRGMNRAGPGGGAAIVVSGLGVVGCGVSGQHGPERLESRTPRPGRGDPVRQGSPRLSTASLKSPLAASSSPHWWP
ncbi:hypothetical protein, partial [Pseudonocardia sp. D17]|uniref:hypothetical protein n=1 Tax=Pseudonocardia sp. D17 TaxID=882661 RepID=UPI0030D06262